ncbi:beta-N-acetylhexosaminidase [Leucobacter luti]|uniref:glycoside hydrolase family 3 protein n=1 Tax=Leucobacter luti TaxID=340320 RepID=UPI0010517D26|nr:glycoside hydrolase family 3 N-terminal domain-containing protein [Leucobacter luti]MCW2289673.1 beta-N-acetylhexosaminidase [Leucobacter luti]TCK37844.1 beta-N-acetylhexosaminidase [Leucobacter luti]
MSGAQQSAPSELRLAVRATLMPGFDGFTAPEWIIAALGNGLQSVCVYGANVRDRAQLAALGAQLQSAAPGALVAIDEEGGEVTRLHYLNGAPYPGAAILGRIDDLSYTEEIGRRVATDILASGFTLALAPDADVNSNPENPVIGTRSFGTDPELAARHTAAWVRGLQSAGAIACPKHFPGHGDTAQDSHLALPQVNADLALLDVRDLPPFRAAIAAGARAIMTSHILLPHLDDSGPATFSRPILQGLLREHLGFVGAIVTDALDMQGASGGIGIPEAAVRALAAGCDLLCLGTSTGADGMRDIEDHVLAAIDSGRLEEARVREAAARVRELRAVSGASEGVSPVPLEAPDVAELDWIAASFAGGAAARAWLAAHPSARVIRVNAETNMAVGFAPWGPFATSEHPVLPQGDSARSFARRPGIAVSHATAVPWLPDAEASSDLGTIVIGRDLHRHAFARAGIDALRAAGHAVLTVDMGWPADPGVPGGYAELASYGSSALAGAALLRITEGARA